MGDLDLAEHCYIAHRDALLAQIGILYWPADAADLLSWIGAHAAFDLEQDCFPIDGARAESAHVALYPAAAK